MPSANGSFLIFLGLVMFCWSPSVEHAAQEWIKPILCYLSPNYLCSPTNTTSSPGSNSTPQFPAVKGVLFLLILAWGAFSNWPSLKQMLAIWYRVAVAEALKTQEAPCLPTSRTFSQSVTVSGRAEDRVISQTSA